MFSSDYKLSQCEFERTYLPCNNERIDELEADVAICQHGSTITPSNSFVQQPCKLNHSI